MKLQKLPVGIQTFEKVRQNGYLYVDKTQFLVDLIGSGQVYFLSRPRRFGKSLTVTTLEALFSGRKELFDGSNGQPRLAAAEFMERPGFESSPVIHFDISKTSTSDGLDNFRKTLTRLVYNEAARLGIELEGGLSYAAAFDQLIINTAVQTKKQAVVLIDEYDSPYLEYFTQPDVAHEIRNILRDFYTNVKANEQYLRFIFITGISKFTKMGVFSTLNNLNDISMDPRFGEMVGISEEEMEDNFAPWLEEAAKKYKTTVPAITQRIKDYYDGFSFDGEHYLYNTFSLLQFFWHSFIFLNYWMNSGGTRLVADYVKIKKLTIEQFRGMPVSSDFVFSPGEMETAPPAGFLFQGGYLSLRMDEYGEYSLDYPNTEVLNAMSQLLMQNVTQTGDEVYDMNTRFTGAVANKDAQGIVDTLNSLLCSIPFDDYASAAKQSNQPAHYRISTQEWLYRSMFLAFLRGMGILVFGEMHNSRGREDMTVVFRGKALVIELKVALHEDSPEAKLEEALAQIQSQNYGAEYPDAMKLALVIEDSKRQISVWQAV